MPQTNGFVPDFSAQQCPCGSPPLLIILLITPEVQEGVSMQNPGWSFLLNEILAQHCKATPTVGNEGPVSCHQLCCIPACIYKMPLFFFLKYYLPSKDAFSLTKESIDQVKDVSLQLQKHIKTPWKICSTNCSISSVYETFHCS